MRLLDRTGADAPKERGLEVAPAGRWDACQGVRTRLVNGRWSGSSTSRASLQSRQRCCGEGLSQDRASVSTRTEGALRQMSDSQIPGIRESYEARCGSCWNLI